MFFFLILQCTQHSCLAPEDEVLHACSHFIPGMHSVNEMRILMMHYMATNEPLINTVGGNLLCKKGIPVEDYVAHMAEDLLH